MIMAGLEGSYDPRPLYEKIYEFIVEYIKQHGTRRGAFAEAARIFYPQLYEKNPRYATNLVFDRFRYAIRKKYTRTHDAQTTQTYDTQTYGLDTTLENPEKYDMSYIVRQSRPLKQKSSWFKRDMELPRPVFEFKKLLIALVREIYNDGVARKAVNQVHTLVSDERVLEILMSKKIWYNSKSYVKLDKESAALAYIILLKIHMNLYGLSQKPRKLLAIYTAYTRYTPEDVKQELKKLTNKFYDWFLFLS